MAEYQVIARKWRPQTFADVVGQEHVLQTLKNAIRQQRTAHAYLFVGPRGIGKTTTARIFAKALNCLDPQDGEPCCKCRSCVSIANENNMDVIEIDAASQNSVENIRELRDEVMHVPIDGKYKIYIIDEVHMLSKQAWNALLKTVEEPPPHAKFIFATTEVHMVLPTIISRCQRFDLQRIPSNLISERLRRIADTEGVKISNPAIEAIARAADGGMRDAQSLLDQMIAFFSGSGQEISEQDILSLFGLSATTEIEALVKAILNNDKGGVIANIHALAVRGKNLETLYDDLLEWLRGIQLCQLLANPEAILESGTETINRYRALGQNIRQQTIQRLLETLSPVGRVLHDALNKQVYIESIILKAMRSAHAVQIEDLLKRLNQLRQAGDLKFLEQVPPVGAATAQTTPPPSLTTVEIPVEAEVKTPPVTPQPEPEIQPPQSPAATPEATTAEEPVPPPAENIEPEQSSVEAQPPATETATEIKPESDENFNLTPAEEESAVLPQPVAPPAPDELWHQMIANFDEQPGLNPLLKGYMQEAVPEKIEDKILVIGFDAEFEQEHFSALHKAQAQIERLVPIEYAEWIDGVSFECHDGIAEIASPEAEEEGMKSLRGIPEVKEKVESNEFVKTVIDLFDGTTVDIHG